MLELFMINKILSPDYEFYSFNPHNMWGEILINTKQIREIIAILEHNISDERLKVGV